MVLLFFSGALAGVSNAIAGGGTFFTFPVFLASGIPPIMANASNAVAVWPGNAMAVVGYRQELKKTGSSIRLSLVLVLIGGTLGAWLLTVIDNTAFLKLIPFLIFFATLLFAQGSNLVKILKRNSFSKAFSSPPPGFKRLTELAFATYGGFFGAGYGVMLLAWLEISTNNDIQTNNGLKNLISCVVGSVAAAIFAFSGLVSWPHTLVAFSGATAGGLVGAKIARWLSALWLRRVVISFCLFLSGYYFFKYYS